MSVEILALTQNPFAWYNAVFVACFAIGLFFTFLQVLGLGNHDADAHVEAHVDAHADVDAHVVGAEANTDLDTHAAVDHDVDHGADAGVSGHAETAGNIGGAQAMAQFLGIGRVPVSAILMTLCYAVGIAGWIANTALAPRFESERSLFLTSLTIALVVGLFTMRLVTGLLARYMPSVLTSAMSRRQMVGLIGEASLPITERFGRADVRDKYGTLHQVNCKVPPGIRPIDKHAKVVLTKYLAEEDMYYVGRAD